MSNNFNKKINFKYTLHMETDILFNKIIFKFNSRLTIPFFNKMLDIFNYNHFEEDDDSLLGNNFACKSISRATAVRLRC